MGVHQPQADVRAMRRMRGVAPLPNPMTEKNSIILSGSGRGVKVTSSVPFFGYDKKMQVF